MNINNFSERIGRLISKDKIEQAIKEMSTLLQTSPYLNEMVIQSARYNDLKRKIRLGTVDNEDAQVTKNKIVEGILDLANEITDFSDNNDQVQTEANQALAKMFPSGNNITIINQENKDGGHNIGGNMITHN